MAEVPAGKVNAEEFARAWVVVRRSAQEFLLCVVLDLANDSAGADLAYRVCLVAYLNCVDEFWTAFREVIYYLLVRLNSFACG